MTTTKSAERLAELATREAHRAIEREVEARAKLAADLTGEMEILPSSVEATLNVIAEGKFWRRLLKASETRDVLDVLTRMRGDITRQLLDGGTSTSTSQVANAMSAMDLDASRLFLRNTAYFVEA